MARVHREAHLIDRIGWLRASVLGANDGIVSTASLIVGVAAAESTRASILVAGIAGLVAGAMSMAAGEYAAEISLVREKIGASGAPHWREFLAAWGGEAGPDRT